MYTLVGVSLFKDFDVKVLKEVMSLDCPIQLIVDSKDTFDSIVKDIEPVISNAPDLIVSLRGPFKESGSKGNTLFDDTVEIVTTFEDKHKVIFDSLTCFTGYGWKTIEELVDFWLQGLKFNVANDPFRKEEFSPFDMALQIESSTDFLATDVNISYDVCHLNKAWLNPAIVNALSGHIGEIFLDCSEGTLHELDEIRVIQELKEFKDVQAVFSWSNSYYRDNLPAVKQTIESISRI